MFPRLERASPICFASRPRHLDDLGAQPCSHTSSRFPDPTGLSVQVSVTLDAYDKSPKAFEAIPKMPVKLMAHGAQVGVRSVVDGIISKVRTDKVHQL